MSASRCRVFRTAVRPNEGFHEGPVVSIPATAGEEHVVGTVLEVARIDIDGPRLLVGQHLPARHEARCYSDIKVWSAEVRVCLVGIEVLGRRFPKTHFDWLAPAQKVR